LVRFFLSPEGAAVFLPASFFSAGAFPAGALPPVVGVFCALGGILGKGVVVVEMGVEEWETG
jgi:membrane associated rhomboid family serine protease|tara:strand:+ start:6364 stop:6549 length:186 start_codon:yes stop_codon:yes gene_type:complete